MKKLLTRLSTVLLLVTIVISAISMSGHVFAQTDIQNQNNIVDVENDENQSTKVTLQSSEESLRPTTGKTADSEQTESSEKIAQKETTENIDIESEENTTDSEVQQNSEENSSEQPESSLFSDRLRPSDTLTAGSLEIEDTRSLSKYDTTNTLKDFTYTVSFSNLTPEKIYKYQTTSNTKYFTAERDGTATLQIVLRANQTVIFSDVANASYKITTSENATSAASYTAIAGDGVLNKTSDQAEIGSTLSSEMETVSATSGTLFTFKHQFYYNFIIDSTVKSASAISLSAHLVFPSSMKGQLIQIEGTGSSVAVGDDAAADMPIVNGQKMILCNISSSDIDQMYDSSELISIPDVSGYTSSLTKHIEDNGDITANISYKEYGYQIIYHGNGADDGLTENVVDDDIQDTYSFSVRDTSNSHYLYVDLTRNGNTMNYKITLSPIGTMYLRDREGTIAVNGVKKSVTITAHAGKITEIDSGSFELNDSGDTYFSCKVEVYKKGVIASNWTADFGNNKLGTRTKYEVSKIIDDLTYSEVKNLHANPYTKTGYRFTGWNTKADGTGIEYTETQEVSKLAATDKDEDSIDLYAQWTPIKYSVKYSGNGATVGSMSNSSYTYDQTGNLAQNQFEKNYTLTFNHNYPGSTDSTLISKCKFNGWNGSDGKKYADKAEVKNLTSKNNDVITMTARWTPASVTLPSPSRDGYTFDGWYSAASGGNKVGSAGDSITPESNETYYAHWTANNYTYKIRYVSSSGKLLGEDTVSGNFDSERTVTPPSKNGYTTPAVQKVVFDSISAKTITFTYEPVKYSITYDLQGGSATGNPASYTIESSAITLNAPSKSKHDFTGWSGTGIIGTSKEVKIPKGSTENRSYTANWKINQYDIVIKGDKGTESITYDGKTYPLTATQSVTIHADYGTNTAVTYKVKKGFHIVNETGQSMSNTLQTWTNNTNKEGSAGGQSWTTCAFTRTITVNTAQNKFVLSFGDGNGGTSGSQNATFGNGEKVTFNAAKKPGYTFKNWNTKTDGTGKSYPDGVSIDKIDASNGSTVTLYPIYRPNVLTFHFYANGADNYRSTPDEKTHTVTADEKANKTEIALSQNVKCMKYDADVNTYGIVDSQRLSKTGYTSTNKWHANSVSGVLLDANNGVYAKTQDLAQAAGILNDLENGDVDLNLYADWLANTYTVKFDVNGGTGNPVTQKMTYDKDTAFTPVSYTRAKHRFLYWTENADGSGKKYTDKANVKNLTATDNGTVTLYAQWEKLTDLKIMNTVSGNMGNRAKDFQFSTAFPACFQNRTFTVIKGDGTKETATIGADGAVKFSLKHGETFTFTDLDPEQINAIKNLGNRDIIESDYTAEGYRTTYAASTEDNGTLRVDFNNAKNSGVPTGLHLGDASLLMAIVGALGIIEIAILKFLKNKK